MFYLNVHPHVVALTVLRLWNYAVFYLQPGVGQVNACFLLITLALNMCRKNGSLTEPLICVQFKAWVPVQGVHYLPMTVSLLNLKLSQKGSLDPLKMSEYRYAVPT